MWSNYTYNVSQLIVLLYSSGKCIMVKKNEKRWNSWMKEERIKNKIVHISPVMRYTLYTTCF